MLAKVMHLLMTDKASKDFLDAFKKDLEFLRQWFAEKRKTKEKMDSFSV